MMNIYIHLFRQSQTQDPMHGTTGQGTKSSENFNDFQARLKFT